MEPGFRNEPIAVIGAGLRFPGGNDTLDGFTDFLRQGGSGIVPLPADRFAPDWLAPQTADQDGPDGRIRTAGGGFLSGIDEFDAPFFNISPREARYLDPQQRLLLETAWAALENANLDPASLRHGDGGVFIGASSIDYALEMESIPYEELDPALATGFTIYPMSGRLSYFLGWRGPSLSTDTACSSSVTALHLAVGALRRGECEIALVGAVNLIHHPRTLVLFSHGRMLAADGHSKSFDEAADGYARAEGCGVLILKRLSEAERHADTVLALVRGSAIGQDGESAGLTVPNGTAQERVVRAALADAGLEPGDIQYVEAHGTGTSLGDPIEAGSINAVFGTSHSKDKPLYIGSLKSNLGHMEPAAGLGGIIKTILQMQAGEFFPHLYKEPSGRIPWDTYPIAVPVHYTPWDTAPRRAAVNSFGFAGSIGVVVLEQAPALAVTSASSPASEPAGHVFTISAKSQQAFDGRVSRYREYLERHPQADVGDLCYTANVGRAGFPLRAAGVVRNRDELAALLDTLRPPSGPARMRKSAFLFAGTGTQHTAMGASLYANFPAFRQHIDACDEMFADELGVSVKELMYSPAKGPARIHEVRYAQPAIFTLEYALAKLWLSWGIRPTVLLGHSLGEIVAAAVAGLFDLHDAVRFTARRAMLLHSARTPGAMAAVALAADEVRSLIEGHEDLALAAVNSPRQCVIAGRRASVNRIVEELTARGVKATRLAVSAACHSPLMREVVPQLRELLATVQFREPTLTLVSNLTGQVAGPGELASPDYWVNHLCGTVDFEAGMRTIEARGRHVFVEIGSGAAMTSAAVQCVTAGNHEWLTSLHPGDSDGVAILRAVGAAYAAGLPLSWNEFYRERERIKIQLPTYAFEHKRYWLPKPFLHSPGMHASGPGSPAGVAPAHATSSSTAPDDSAAKLASVPDHAFSAVAADDNGRTSNGAVPALDIVLAVTAKVLQIEDLASIEASASFVELGLNSLMSAEFTNLLDSKGFAVPSSAVFDYPSPLLLAEQLEDERLTGRSR